jgi:predicted dehydrogenase
MGAKKRFALVGTGARAGMYVTALADTYRDSCELVGLCDLSPTRMNWYNRQLHDSYG